MITERMQCNLLYRAFVKNEDVATLGELDIERWCEPWRTIALFADRPQAANSGDALWYGILAVAGKDHDRARALQRQIVEAAEPMEFLSLLEIADTLPPVGWLWPNWIPRGMLSLLGAFQGTGKSWMVLDLARIVIDGGVWPDGSPVERTGCVVYVDAEGIPQVLNERAVALNINRRKLFLQMAEPGEVFDLSRREWQDRLIDAVMTLRPQLVIIDSLSSISSTGQNSVEEINALLAFLVGLAREADCGLLMIHHLRKPAGGQLYLPGLNIHDFRGSGHITAMARTVLGLSVVQSGKQFSLNGPRRLDLVKTNLGPYPQPLGIEMVSDGNLTKFVYGRAPEEESAQTVGDKAEVFLVKFLQENGPSLPAEVVAGGEEAGHSRSTIYRIRKEMGDRIVNTAGRRSHSNRWALPEQVSVDGVEDDADRDEIDGDQDEGDM